MVAPTKADSKGAYGEIAHEAMAERPVITPLPRLKLGIVFLITLNESFTENVVWPFLPFMMKDFGYQGDEVGYYVGLLVSCYFVAQLSSSLPWGKLSDIYGRRPTLLLGLLGTSAAILGFGFSPNFAMAMLARVASGLLNGNLGINKTYAAEITDGTNRAQAYTIITVGWGVGGITAPAIGGLLSKPAEQWPAVFGSSQLFINYPYLLPCLFTAVHGIATLLLGVFCLPETERFKQIRERRSKKTGGRVAYSAVHLVPADVSRRLDTDAEDTQGPEMLSDLESSANELSSPPSTISPLRAMRLSPVHSASSEALSTAAVSLLSPNTQEPVPSIVPSSLSSVFAPLSTSPTASTLAPQADKDKGLKDDDKPTISSPSMGSHDTAKSAVDDGEDDKLTTWQVIKQKDVLVSTACYGLLCLVWVLYDETFAVFCEASVPEGGLALTESQIGTLLAITGCSSIVFQIVGYGRFARRFGPVKGYKIFLLAGAPFFLTFPLTNVVAAYASDTVLWIVLACFMIYRGVVSGSVYTGVCLAVNNSFSSEYTGVINGFSQCLGALGRAIGPITGGALWSLSLAWTVPGHNYVLFLFATVLLFVTIVISRHLSSALDLPYEERHPTTSPTQANSSTQMLSRQTRTSSVEMSVV